MSRRAKFLLMSNMRSASTWLATTLGALPDTVTDYEMKWKVEYPAQPVHLVLDETSPPVVEILEHLGGDAAVAGSKFVFDLVDLSRADFIQLREKLRGDLRIVHLIRRYRDIFLSRRRGFFHQLNDAGSWRIGEHLKAGLDAARPPDTQPAREAVRVSPAECYEELKIFLQNDIWTSSVREMSAPYMLVSYERLEEQLGEIVTFIGSSASAAAVARLIKTPTTVKLPAVPAERLVANIAELDPLFEQFEQLRGYLLGDAVAAEYGAARVVQAHATAPVRTPPRKGLRRLVVAAGYRLLKPATARPRQQP
jgi:hypothetical protein